MLVSVNNLIIYKCVFVKKFHCKAFKMHSYKKTSAISSLTALRAFCKLRKIKFFYRENQHIFSQLLLCFYLKKTSHEMKLKCTKIIN